MNLEGKVRRNPRGSQESPGNVESDYCTRTKVPRPVCASWHFVGSRPATRDVAWCRGIREFPFDTVGAVVHHKGSPTGVTCRTLIE